MAKQNRGKVLAKLPSRSRGTCPVCFTTRTKLVYKRKKSDGNTLLICKKCINVKNETINTIHPISQPLAFRRKHRKLFNLSTNQLKQTT